MILADTSVWIDHLRFDVSELRELLGRGEIVIHPLVIAELALGNLRARGKTLALLDLLPQSRVARIDELRALIEGQRLYGLGIGITDVHLISSVLITPGILLWTRDKQLRKVAETLSLHASLP